MKGVILAGGKGTRLLPATRVTNKHMVPILNCPMITYPLETLKTLGVTEILIVSGGDHIGGIAEFLGDGHEFGVELTYRVQKEAGGIAQALGLAKDFAAGERIAVILGDNIFDNSQFSIPRWNPYRNGAFFFVKAVPDAKRFGVLTTVEGKKRIIEKPDWTPADALVVTGLYIYPPNVFDIIPMLKPSARGELEITDINNHYIDQDLYWIMHVDGFWSDAGTPDSLFEVIKWAHNH